MPRELEIVASDAIPDDLRQQEAEMALFGDAIPQDWGGLGLDLVQLAMELGYTSLAVRSMFGTNSGIAGQVLVGFRTDAQKQQWLPRLAEGDVASFALTEPRAGSDPAGLRTTATRDGDDWIISGPALVGDERTGYRAAMTSLARGRIHIEALAVGSAQRALDESVSYAATATQGGTPIGDFQLVQAMLADQQTGVMAGRALVREAARLYVTGEDQRIAPSVAKLFCTEMVGKVADPTVQVHGGTGPRRQDTAPPRRHAAAGRSPPRSGWRPALSPSSHAADRDRGAPRR